MRPREAPECEHTIVQSTALAYLANLAHPTGLRGILTGFSREGLEGQSNSMPTEPGTVTAVLRKVIFHNTSGLHALAAGIFVGQGIVSVIVFFFSPFKGRYR